MSGLFSKPKIPKPAPIPSIPNVSAQARRRERALSDSKRSRGKRGAKGTILTAQPASNTLLGE